MGSRGDPTRHFAMKASLLEGRHLWRVATGTGPAYSCYACSPTFWEFFTGNKMIGWMADLKFQLI
jgi:hypothetical protein